jgi:hypothetical protein
MSEQLATLAYHNFVETCRSPATRKGYVKALIYFMSYLHLQPDAYDKLLEKDPKLIQMDVCDFVSYLRKKGAAYATFQCMLLLLTSFIQ